MILEIKRLSENATLPKRAHDTDSGIDLCASEDVIIRPGENVIVPTDIAIKLPEGYEGQVRPRSGVTSKTKLRVNLGTIDESYRGPIGVMVDNISQVRDDLLPSNVVKVLDGEFPVTFKHITPVNTYLIRKGDRIAQLVVTPVALPQVVEVDELDETERGDSGYGASGVR